ncbi:metal ABC transporter ATP-binding protein [Haloechinothrix salitolerans]|uniref:Metal ABC transporter ATP-binding protein n=1 Tax=Haloechinothrix salitolerans TaxID=926830 RepID=A0ABW2C2H2_9PSEU
MTPDAPMDAVLSVRDLTVSFGSSLVLRSVHLTVYATEGVALLGQNGAGKSSLLRAIAGLQPYRGDVDVPSTRHRASSVAFVAQTSGGGHGIRWDLPLNVSDVVGFGLLRRRRPRAGRGKADREAIADAIARVGLTPLARRPINTLSGGQRQRVLLARALVQRPDVLLLDEPFAGVDADTRDTLGEHLHQLRGAGVAVLCALHEEHLAHRFFSRVLTLESGRLHAPPLLSPHDTRDMPHQAGEPAWR